MILWSKVRWILAASYSGMEESEEQLCDMLEENLQFVADALGGAGSSREVIRGCFMNDFYADHLQTYQKRPIYWLFDSGKKNGFKCWLRLSRGGCVK